MLYEIRNYYVKPEALETYAHWVTEHALPYLRRELDLVDFWLVAHEAPQVTGESLDTLGTANIVWVLRWQDRETRDRVMAETFGPGATAWREITGKHPGRENYRRIEVKFARSLVED